MTRMGTKESFWSAVNFLILHLGGRVNTSMSTLCVYLTPIQIFIYKNFRQVLKGRARKVDRML